MPQRFEGATGVQSVVNGGGGGGGSSMPRIPVFLIFVFGAPGRFDHACFCQSLFIPFFLPFFVPYLTG
jgi:hypothetical protein